MRGRGTAAVVVLVALALAACGAADSGSAPIETAAPTTSTSTTSTTAAPATTSSTSPPATRPGTAATTAPPADELSGFQTDPFRREHPTNVPPVPTLTAIRTAHHGEGYDRVVFDFDGPLPGAVAVRYVDRVVADGSGNTVILAGDAFLLVRFEGAQAHTDAGQATVPNRTRPGLPAVTEIVIAGDYEGYVTVALGINNAKAPFRVLELSNPTRVVVDVASR